MRKTTKHSMRSMDFRWPKVEASYTPRLRKVLNEWNNTPYGLGQQVKGVGVDCIRFVTGVLDDMFKRPYIKFPLISQDCCLTDHKQSKAIYDLLLQHYPSAEVKPNPDGSYDVEPGDLVCCGPLRGTLGHGMVVGADPGTMFHATTFSVVKAGCSFMEYGVYSFKQVLRPKGKDSW